MAETVFSWISTGATAFAFFLGYGMIEDLIRQWLSSRRSRKAKRSSPQPSPERGYGA